MTENNQKKPAINQNIECRCCGKKGNLTEHTDGYFYCNKSITGKIWEEMKAVEDVTSELRELK